MIQSAEEFRKEMKRDIERWNAEIAAADAAGFPEISAEIRTWVKAGEDLLSDQRGEDPNRT